MSASDAPPPACIRGHGNPDLAVHLKVSPSVMVWAPMGVGSAITTAMTKACHRRALQDNAHASHRPFAIAAAGLHMILTAIYAWAFTQWKSKVQHEPNGPRRTYRRA